MALVDAFLSLFTPPAPSTKEDAASAWATELAPYMGGSPATTGALGTVKLASTPTDPANPVALNAEEATTTPTASKVPRADGSGRLATGWLPTLINALRGYHDRVRDVSTGSTIWSNYSASTWAGTSMGQWHVYAHGEGSANLRYCLTVTRSMSSYNSGASRWHVMGIKTDGSGTTTLVSASAAESTSDVALFTDGVISILIGGTSTGNTGKIGFSNSSGGYMDTLIRHYAEGVNG